MNLQARERALKVLPPRFHCRAIMAGTFREAGPGFCDSSDCTNSVRELANLAGFRLCCTCFSVSRGLQLTTPRS